MNKKRYNSEKVLKEIQKRILNPLEQVGWTFFVKIVNGFQLLVRNLLVTN